MVFRSARKAAERAITTISRLPSASRLRRKLSRTKRLMRFLSAALRMFFLVIASPKRAPELGPGRARTVR